MGLARDDDLFPDGVRIVVNWDAMLVGHSIFVPCLNHYRMVRDARKILSRRGWQFRFSVRTEDNILGVRIWRIA
jgi:hypothetical protein